MVNWIEQSPEFIAQRYDRLAPCYGALEWLYNSRRGLLGKPDTEPWRDLEQLAGAVEVRRISLFGLGHFFICAATEVAA